MEEGRKKLDLLHPLGVVRYFFLPLLHKFQGSSFFTNSSSLKLHGKNNNRNKVGKGEKWQWPKEERGKGKEVVKRGKV
jgi:hypothetical protein